MMAILLVLVTMTLPRYVAGNGECLGTGHALTDLDSVMVWYVPRWTIVPLLAKAASVRGMEGQSFDADIPTTSVATVYAVTKRIGAKRWSCDSNMIGVNLVLEVDARAEAKLEWFDLLGRRLEASPSRPGLYWTRLGASKRKVVMLR